MNPRAWEALLVEATERAMRKVTDVAAHGDRGRTLGVGASGDRTIAADREAEVELMNSIMAVGGVRILSEEAGIVGEESSKTLAVVDPLDGSSNFERGIPFYCTSVALVEGSTLDDVTVGVVRDFVSGDVFAAVRGGGATKNGKTVRTSGVDSLSDAVVGVDLSRSSGGQVSLLAPLIAGSKRQVHLGANALELCYLAQGNIDAFVDIRGKIRITDFAAAYLIAREAGGVFTDRDGGELEPTFDLQHRFSFVASGNELLHREILRTITEEGKPT